LMLFLYPQLQTGQSYLQVDFDQVLVSQVHLAC
jgi:hypothetical protein